MDNLVRLRFRVQKWYILLLVSILAGGCTASPSIYNPAGPAAREIAWLGWLMFAIAGLVVLIVIVYLLMALYRKRSEPAAEVIDDNPGSGRRAILIGGIIGPVIILVILFGLVIGTLRAVAAPEQEEPVTIEVIGHQWWWEIRYPDEGVVTANEIHLPAGVPVELKVWSEDVIHSFWVPQLHGKIDTMPGHTNIFWIQADEEGEFWGVCAEYCGIQHANMAFVVVSHQEDDYRAWIDAQKQPAAIPEDEQARRGMDIFLSANCINCHQINGTPATGRLGPDLTHLASRLTLGAGTVRNNRGNLGGWIADPHGVKPGNYMPPSLLAPEDLQALLAYLETLK